MNSNCLLFLTSGFQQQRLGVSGFRISFAVETINFGLSALINRSAYFLSIILHPLLVPTLMFGIIFSVAPELAGVAMLNPMARGSLLLLLFINTFAVPSLFIYSFFRLGLIRSLQLETLRDRRLPYLITIAIYSLCTYLFGWQFDPISELAPQLAIILGSITVSLIIVALVSLNWQISAHATGMGGLVGALAGIVLRYNDFSLFFPLIVSVVLTGALISARLQLNAHTPAQVIAGLFVGLTVSMISIFLFF